MPLCESFPPKVNKNSKVLILGSMPGPKSLEMQQYYAHKQNRFWKLMGLLCKCPDMAGFEYNKRVEILLDNGFALWDVMKYCIREGALDSNIKNAEPNDFQSFLTDKNIKIILFNGQKAFDTFKKHFPDLLKKYKCAKMPSTSPANAKFSLEILYNEWSHFINSNI